MAPDNSLGREIHRLRTASGMTLAELSARTGVREAYIADIEDDREEPSARALALLVKPLQAAGANYDELVRLLGAPEFDRTGAYTNVDLSATRETLRTGGDRVAPSSPAPAAAADTSTRPNVWRHKSDQQVVDAVSRLHEYTDEGQRAILAELDRRGLARPDSRPSHAATVGSLAEPGLQFDEAIGGFPSVDGRVAVTCEACGQSIDTEYYDVNGHVTCGTCRLAAASAAETPRGIARLVIAGVFGLGAAIAGAILYYAVIAITHLQIGYLAILLGYMVGYAVRRGARGRGGRRFQVLAVALTYASIARADTPIAIGAAVRANRDSAKTNAAAVSRPADVPPAPTPSVQGLLLAAAAVCAFIAALPLLMVWEALPSGLITAFIIFIGLRQAWKMTAAPVVQVLGPYRVGPASSVQA